MTLVISQSNSSRRSTAILVCAAICGSVAFVAGARSAIAAGEPSADDVLHDHGLQRIGGNWSLAEESGLRDRLVGLDRLEQRLIGAQRAVDEIVGENEACHAQLLQLQAVVKNLRAAAAQAKPGTAQRIQLDSQVKAAAAAVEQLQRIYIPSDQFGLSAPLKPALNDLIIVRTDMMVRLLPMRETMDRLTQRYHALHDETAVTAALASLTPKQTLGLSRSLLDGWKIVNKLQPMVFSDSVPVSRDGKIYRVTAIVNERQPLTFSFVGTGEPTLIPQNLAEAAGLIVNVKAAQTKLRVAKDRDEMAWRMKVPRLRFGRHVLHDVDAYILAPEAADIGARIGAGAFAGYRVQLDADRLLLTVGGGK